MEHTATEQNNGAKETVKTTMGIYSPCIKISGKRNVRATIYPLFPRHVTIFNPKILACAGL